MDLFLEAVLRTLLGVFTVWHDDREAKRYGDRNAAGQCALCGCASAGREMRQIDYSTHATRGLQRLDVCTGCLARRRRQRIVAWTVLVATIAAALWWAWRQA